MEASTSNAEAAHDCSEDLQTLLGWPNVRRMMRTVCDLSEACPLPTRGSNGSPDYSALLANAPPEALAILHYLAECVGTSRRQRTSAFQQWMQRNQDWERGRRFLGIPDICLPQPTPPYIDYNQELATASPVLYDMYVADLLRLLSYGSNVTMDPDPYLDLFRWMDPAAASGWLPARGQGGEKAEPQAEHRNCAEPGCSLSAQSGVVEGTDKRGALLGGSSGAGGSGSTGAVPAVPAAEGCSLGPGRAVCGLHTDGEHVEDEAEAAEEEEATREDGEDCGSPPRDTDRWCERVGTAADSAGAAASSVFTCVLGSAAASSTSSWPPSSSSASAEGQGDASPSTAASTSASAASPTKGGRAGAGSGAAAAAAAAVSATPISCHRPSPAPAVRQAAAAGCDTGVAASLPQTAEAVSPMPLSPMPLPPMPLPAPPFGSGGAAAAARLSRRVPGVGLVPEEMFLKAPKDAVRLPPLPHGGVPVDWRSRLPVVLQVAHPALPWYSPARGGGLVLAGGAALAMAVPGAAASDVDLFLVVPSRDPTTGVRRTADERRTAAWLLVQEALDALSRQVAVYDRSLKVYATAGSDQHTVDLLVMEKDLGSWTPGTHVVAQVQLVLRLYESPAQVIHGFDVDVCAVLYDGREVWATGRALRALHCGFLLMEPVRQSPSYEVRLHKYSKRLGFDILIPGLDPILLGPAVQELDAMKSQLSSQLDARQSARWIQSERDRQAVVQNFHRHTRVPSIARFAARQSGLARLLLVQRLGELGVTAEEAKLSVTAYRVSGGTSADAAANRAHVYFHWTQFIANNSVTCVLVKPNLGNEEPEWARFRSLVNFQVDGVHLQVGREPLFSGSFTHTPFNDWYRCCLSKLEERLLRGEVDWEARARERIIHERDSEMQLSADEVERRLEARCEMYLNMLAAMRAGRQGAGTHVAGGGSISAAIALAAAARAFDGSDSTLDGIRTLLGELLNEVAGAGAGGGGEAMLLQQATSQRAQQMYLSYNRLQLALQVAQQAAQPAQQATVMQPQLAAVLMQQPAAAAVAALPQGAARAVQHPAAAYPGALQQGQQAAYIPQHQAQGTALHVALLHAQGHEGQMQGLNQAQQILHAQQQQEMQQQQQVLLQQQALQQQEIQQQALLAQQQALYVHQLWPAQQAQQQQATQAQQWQPGQGQGQGVYQGPQQEPHPHQLSAQYGAPEQQPQPQPQGAGQGQWVALDRRTDPGPHYGVLAEGLEGQALPPPLPAPHHHHDHHQPPNAVTVMAPMGQAPAPAESAAAGSRAGSVLPAAERAEMEAELAAEAVLRQAPFAGVGWPGGGGSDSVTYGLSDAGGASGQCRTEAASSAMASAAAAESAPAVAALARPHAGGGASCDQVSTAAVADVFVRWLVGTVLPTGKAAAGAAVSASAALCSRSARAAYCDIALWCGQTVAAMKAWGPEEWRAMGAAVALEAGVAAGLYVLASGTTA